MKKKLKRAAEYIFHGVPNYNIEVTNAKFTNNDYLKNKIVLITGGNKGIGLAIANRVVESGGKVIITGRNKKDLDDAKNKLGKNCFAQVLDMKNISEFDSFLEKMTKKFGKINCLVNNAGISLHERDFLEVTEESWDEQIDINLKGTFFLTQSYVKYYKKEGMKEGKIINIVSETSIQPAYRPYGISKTALASFTRWLAQAYILDGIRVNAIAPGVTETNMTNFVTKGEKLNNSTKGKRTFSPDEIAEVCCFLLSDASNSISGQIIVCNEANAFYNNI